MFRIFREFEAIHPISKKLKEDLSSALQEKVTYKGLHLLMAGETCRNVYFVEKGFLKGYYRVDGRLYTSRFMKEGDMAIAPQSFFSQTPSAESIIPVKDGKVYYMDLETFHRLFRDYSSFSFIMLTLLVRDYLLVDQCACVIRTMRAKERYSWLMNNYPWMLKQLQAKDIAPLINLTDVTVSIVKNKLKEQE